MYHQQGSDVLYVGGQGVIYMIPFTHKGVQDSQVDKVGASVKISKVH